MISYKYILPDSLSNILKDGTSVHNKTITYRDCNRRYCPTETFECSNEELEFFEKYGYQDFLIWYELTSQEKEDFKKCLQLYQSFWELYYEYYEDLCLYATMYRNIKFLKPTITDVMSVYFFVSKTDEIKGFKERLRKEKTSKSRVAIVYFYNRNIFTKVFSKYLDYKSTQKTGYNTTYEMRGVSNIIANLNNGITCGVGINNLTDQDCIEILKHTDELMTEYQEAYYNTIEEYVIEEKGYSFLNDFFLSKFIPYYGRVNSKLTKSASSYDKVCNTEITPVLNYDSKDIILSENERYIVQVWCKQMRLKYETIRKEEEERRKIQCLKQDYINTLTIYNNYQLGGYWNDGYEIKFDFLYTKNLFCNKELWPHSTPNIVVNSNTCFELLKQEFDKYLEIKLDEFCSSEGVESSFLTELDFNCYSRYNDNIKGRVIIWDEYGIKFDEKTMSPISPEDIKSFNYKIISHDYNNSEPPCIDEFINYVKKNPNVKLYITKNENCVKQDYIAEIVRIRDNVKIVTQKQDIYPENTSKVESLYEQEFYECLSTRQILRGVLYRELCRYIDFNGIVITWYSEENFVNTLFHKIETEMDKKEGDRKKIKGQFVDNYRWCFEIAGGNILKNRIKEVFKEDNRNKEKVIRQREEEERLARIRYNIRNKHYRDSFISFDEATHLYKVDGVTLQSVTNFVEGCFPKFDAEFFAKKKAAYMGITTQEVLDMWEQKGKESRELGTELHKKIENYYQDIASTEDDSFKLFLMFANKIELKPYRTEWAVYDVKHNIAGTIDFVDYQNGEYIIYDWKRSDKIIDNGMPIKISKYDEKGNYPLEHLDNTPYYHYALQLSIYKFILENNYNMKISDLRLGIFHPTYNKPYVLRIPYLEKEINDLFNLRSEVLF